MSIAKFILEALLDWSTLESFFAPAGGLAMRPPPPTCLLPMLGLPVRADSDMSDPDLRLLPISLVPGFEPLFLGSRVPKV